MEQLAMTQSFDDMLKEHQELVFREFLELLPEGLRGKARSEIFVAGGAIVNYVLNSPIADYDYFIKTDEGAAILREALVVGGFPLKAQTENALTIVLPSGHVVQLVTRFTGEPARVFKDFDFEHTKCFYDFATTELVYNGDVIRNRKLIYTGEKDRYTLNTLKRMAKFVRRGWNIDNASIINLHKACHNRDLNDPDEMAVQSIGFYGSSFS
jgi:hypothetical protein